MTRRRILFVIPTLDIGGAERQLVALATRLVENGGDVFVYSLAGRGALEGELEHSKATVITPPSGRGGNSGLRLNRFLRQMALPLHLLFVLLKIRPVIVHFNLPAAYLVGAPLSIIAGVPVRIMTRHSMNLYQRDRPLSRSVERLLHQRMHAVIAVSFYILRELRDQEGVSHNRLGVIYNGVDPKRFPVSAPVNEIIRELGLRSTTFVMVIVANLIPYKGHTDLLEAVALAKPDLPDDWRLLIVGRDEGIGSQLRDLSMQLSIEQGVIFLGQRTDIASILCCSHIGILCSHQEGVSIAAMEAMATGLPMIVTDVGGMSELVVDGETGLVVPAKKPQSLARAIGRLAKDPQLRLRLGQAGRERANQKFSLQATVAQYERLYSGLCERTRRTVVEILANSPNESA